MQKLLKRARVMLLWAPLSAGLVLAVTTSVPQARAQDDAVGRVFAEQAAADRDAEASQKRVDAAQDQTLDLAARYRQTLADEQSILKYNQELRKQVEDQRVRLADINRQIAEIETTQRDVVPLMVRMVETIDQFVGLDIPFLLEERKNRVKGLNEILTRGDVPNSEKYRRILEAYQIEMEYGRTLDSYEGKLGGGDADKTVKFVRVGRVALLYQTPDGTETGYWDRYKKDWVIDNDYARDVRGALSVANKTTAPDLVMVPVPAPTQAKNSMAAKQEVQP
jgi:hypothetical protein